RQGVAVDGLTGGLQRHGHGHVERQQHGRDAQEEDDGDRPVDPLQPHLRAPTTRRAGLGAGGPLGSDGRHQTELLPRVVMSWRMAMMTATTKNMVAVAIW